MDTLRRQRLLAEAKDLQNRLNNNGYPAGSTFNTDTMPHDCLEWQARLWYIGFALHREDLPEVP